MILLLDLYTFQAVKTISKKWMTLKKRLLYVCFWSITTIAITALLITVFTKTTYWPVFFRTYLPASLFILYISKIFYIIFLLIDDIRRFFQWSFFTLRDFLFKKNIPPQTAIAKHNGKSIGHKISRSTFLSQMGVIVAGTPFISMIHGMVENAYNYQIHRHTIKLPNLPNEFHGTKIVQISDIHSGSFTKTEPLYDAVKTINKEKADLIFFTGDLVNYRSEEAVEYIPVFKNLEATNGVFSTYGNHDYGDYERWDSVKHKEENLEQLARIHRELGWNLLRNENFILKKNEERLAIIGVENWSAHQRFKKYGDLEKAYRGTETVPAKLLLSHDPSHWESEVTGKYKDIDVMFAGHTHGMQFGIELPGFKWSPIQYMYKQWADLYKKERQFLYVNRGFGFIGYPGRVGIMPEITVFTLEKG